MLHAEIKSACSSHDKEKKAKQEKEVAWHGGLRRNGRASSFFPLIFKHMIYDLAFYINVRKSKVLFFLKKEKRRK
jgi:hypothetical protein